MKFIITAAAVALLSTTTAFAADAVYSYEPVPVAVAEVPAYAWTGAYIGLNAGYGGGTFKHPFGSIAESIPVEVEVLLAAPETYTEVNGSADFTAGGFVGGAQAGYNWQMDNFIFGVETDFQASGIKGSAKYSAYSDGVGSNGEIGTKLDWFGTIRARLGTPVTDRMMVYATGGAAYGRTKSFAKGSETYFDFDEEELVTNNFEISKSVNKWGWTVGAGAEYAVTNNITFKTEYLYTDLGKANLVSFGDEGFSGHLDRKLSFHTVRAGINYKF